jgi:CPA2 family monovalent cation:H+ antiporter-2
LFFSVCIGAIVARFGINRIVGYIIAGVLIGPFTPGVVVRTETVENLAELGLVFLLFSLGLGFSFHEIRSAGAVSIVGNLAVMGVIGAVAGLAASLWGFEHPWILALAAVLSSTAIGVALLRDWGIENESAGHLALGLLVVQDLAGVILLVVVATPAGALSFASLALPVLKALVFVAVALVTGATVLHRIVVRMLERAPTEALFGAFATVALFAGFLAFLAGLPWEFGAFMAGAVISEAAGSEKVASIVMPFRALFVSLFFVGMGMLIDPKVLLANWPIVVGFGSLFLMFRGALWALLGRVAGLRPQSALLFGVALVPLGEFNIVLANAGFGAAAISDYERSILVGITFFSILATTLAAPLFNRFGAAVR